MYQHLNKIILQFEQCFKLKTTWKNFVVLVVGFIVRRSNKGVTSIVSSMRLEPRQYYALPHFFRSTGYTVSKLYEKWIEVAQQETSFKRIAGRIILLGDHIKISKESR